MIGDYVIKRRNDSKEDEFHVDKIVLEYNPEVETTLSGEIIYLNKDLIDQMLGKNND